MIGRRKWGVQIEVADSNINNHIILIMGIKQLKKFFIIKETITDKMLQKFTL